MSVDPAPANERSIEELSETYTVEHLLSAAKLRLQTLNAKQPCRENSLGITKIEEAELWLGKRTADREARSVLGTDQP